MSSGSGVRVWPGVPALRSLGRELGIAAFFLALALVQTRPLGRDLRGSTLAGLDPTIDLWTVSWLVDHALEPRALFGGNVFFPCPRPVLLSDLSLGTVVLLVPLRPLLKDPVVLYNAGVLIALCFGGWAFSRLARTLRGDEDVLAGLVAGTVAVFNAHQMWHVVHLNLITTGWLALLLLGLQQLASRPRPSAAVLVGASLALSAQSSGYYAVAAALLAILFGLTHARRLATPQGAKAIGIAVAVFTLLFLPYLVGFLRLREEAGLRRSLNMSATMALHPAADLGSGSLLYRAVLGGAGEQLFPGLVALLLAAFALVRRRPHAAFYATAAAVLLVLSLGPTLAIGGRSLPLPFRWLFAIPPLDAMRHPYTFAAVALMLLAVVAGLGVPAAPARPRWLAPLLLGAAVAESVAPPVVVRDVPPGVPPAYALLRTLPPGPVLEVPLLGGDSMIWAARHGLPVVNGNGSFAPPQHLAFDRAIENHWLRRPPVDVDQSRPMLLLERFDVRYLVVPAARAPALGRLAEALALSRKLRPLRVVSDGAVVFERRLDDGAGAVPPRSGDPSPQAAREEGS